jgi:hypothetical protein
MKSKMVCGTDDEDAGRRWFVDFYEQWSGLNPFKSFAWRDFTLVNIGGEYAPYTGRFEFTACLLGLSVCVTYVYDRSFNERIVSVADEIRARLAAEHPGCTIADPLGALDELDKVKK